MQMTFLLRSQLCGQNRFCRIRIARKRCRYLEQDNLPFPVLCPVLAELIWSVFMARCWAQRSSGPRTELSNNRRVIKMHSEYYPHFPHNSTWSNWVRRMRRLNCWMRWTPQWKWWTRRVEIDSSPKNKNINRLVQLSIRRRQERERKV